MRPSKTKRLVELPAVLTSFAYRNEYLPELEGMIATVRDHHPDWWLVTGKGPLTNLDRPALEIESPLGKFEWHLPVSFEFAGNEEDWHRIVFMKGWWVAQVWNKFGGLFSSATKRVVWLDADGRLNGSLDLNFEPEAEIFASPWWLDPATPGEHHVCSGLLVFQGVHGGVIENLIDQWSAGCIRAIESPLQPSPFGPWPEGDQDILTKVVEANSSAIPDYSLIKLPYDKYCGVPDYKTGARKPGALVDQWMMNEKMRLPKDRDRSWPPPEAARRGPVG